ncbi:MAG: hypothetical protein JWO14_3796 [Solirubrobacterales bacterium]|nr:hypothetical protein [Solirubrobacterales bacterium]
MNFLKKGPDLKLSDLHVPHFLSDLYYDLKERHLLPLVVLLLVAIVAAPIYFKKKSHPVEASAATAPSITAESGATSADKLTVARSEPGLRDARRRLKHARALDPFAAPASASAEPSSEEAIAGEGEASASVASTPTTTAPTAVAPTEATVTGGESSPPPYEPPAPAETYVPPTSASSGETEASGGESTGTTQPRYASEAIDVRIVSGPASSADSGPKRAKPKPQVRRDLPELTMLPARATPAVTYMGVSKDGKKALLLVSSDVESIFGEAKCIVGSQSCQLLALEPQMPETFVYGPRERTYRIELLKISRTVSAKPRRAALGATKGKHGAQDTEAGSATGASEPAEREAE